MRIVAMLVGGLIATGCLENPGDSPRLGPNGNADIDTATHDVGKADARLPEDAAPDAPLADSTSNVDDDGVIEPCSAPNPADLFTNVNTEEDDEADVSVSENGLELFYLRYGIQIWSSRRSDVCAPWEAPERVVFPNPEALVPTRPTLGADGDTIYFRSTDGMYSIIRSSGVWQEPVGVAELPVTVQSIFQLQSDPTVFYVTLGTFLNQTVSRATANGFDVVADPVLSSGGRPWVDSSEGVIYFEILEDTDSAIYRAAIVDGVPQGAEEIIVPEPFPEDPWPCADGLLYYVERVNDTTDRRDLAAIMPPPL